MAKRRPSGGIPLEWVAVATPAITDAATNVLTTIELNLDDDEMAEILHIDTDIHLQVDADTLADEEKVEGNLTLVMDPSYAVSNNPYSDTVYEDLEAFYNHGFSIEVSTTGAVAQLFFETDSNKQMHFEAGHGIMLANNPAMLVECPTATGTNTATFFVRVYFKRRKATDMQLARTLLKRR